MVKFNFITSSDKNTGSTRQRVLKIQKFLIDNGHEATLNSDKVADVYVFQKSNPSFLINEFYKAKSRGKITVFDIDDYHENTYDYIIKNADLVIVGSKFLKEMYKGLNDNIFVLDDAIDVKDENIPLASYNLRSPKLVWFGNTTNLQQLIDINVPDCCKITKGGDIEWTLDTIDENLQKFDLVLIPQDKSIVGKSKGYCRMLKAVYLGVPALVSDLEAYVDLANIINYPKEFILNEHSNWNDVINNIKSGKISFDFDFEKARKVLQENYSINAIGKKWLAEVLKIKTTKVPLFKKFTNLIKYGVYLKIKDGSKRKIILFGFISFSYKKRKKG